MSRSTAAPRRLLVAAGAVLFASVFAVLQATPALAAPCGNGQGQAMLLGCVNNTSTDTTVLTVTHDNYSALWVREWGAGSWGIRGDGTVRGVSGAGGTYGVYGDGGTYGVYG